MNEHHETPDRRGLLKLCTHALGGLFAVILGVPAVAYLIDARNRKAVSKDFRPVDGIDLEALRTQPEGYVTQAVLRNVREDAWTLHPNDVVGRVYIVKTGAGPEDKDIKVMSTLCPHLGCSVNFAAAVKQFQCPCHNGRFKLDGTLIPEGNPALRGMDALEWQGEKENPKVMKVAYKKFKQNVKESDKNLT